MTAIASRFAGVLVTYSPALAAHAIPRFARLMAALDEKAILLVVNNHPTSQNKTFPSMVNLKGTNRWMEFGGWQEALDAARRIAGPDGLESVVFANDTFCAHRPMGAFEEFAFRQAVRKMMKHSGASAAGQISRTETPFELDGVSMSEWICTYLFALNKRALNAIDWKIHLPDGVPEKWLRGGHIAENFFGPELDAALTAHLRAWLFEPHKPSAWYQAESLTAANAEMFERKARSIIFEKHLSARLMAAGARIFSSDVTPSARIVRKAMRMLERL